MNFFHKTCACDRTFTQLNAYTHHLRSCRTSKKRLADVLSEAQEVWQQRKRPRFARWNELLARTSSGQGDQTDQMPNGFLESCRTGQAGLELEDREVNVLQLPHDFSN